MKKNNRIKIIEIILIIILIVFSLYNIFCNCNFWKINIAQVLTLLVAIMITFEAVQIKTDERKIKEKIENIIERIQNEVSNPNFITFNINDNVEIIQKNITMSNRKLTNYIYILKEYSKVVDMSEEVQYIEKQLKEYRDFVSEKVGDLDYLSKSETHLRKYADNINSKCEYIILKIYLNK